MPLKCATSTTKEGKPYVWCSGSKDKKAQKPSAEEIKRLVRRSMASLITLAAELRKIKNSGSKAERESANKELAIVEAAKREKKRIEKQPQQSAQQSDDSPDWFKRGDIGGRAADRPKRPKSASGSGLRAVRLVEKTQINPMAGSGSHAAQRLSDLQETNPGGSLKHHSKSSLFKQHLSKQRAVVSPFLRI